MTSDSTAGNLPYGASKGALDRIVIAAARELSGRGITANVINPGPVDTGWINDELRESILGASPLSRWLTRRHRSPRIVSLLIRGGLDQRPTSAIRRRPSHLTTRGISPASIGIDRDEAGSGGHQQRHVCPPRRCDASITVAALEACWSSCACPEIERVAVGSKAVRLGHGCRGSEISADLVRIVRVATERDGLASFLVPPAQDGGV